MVLSRRNHVRPTRRRHLVGIVALVSVVFYIVYVWNPFFSSPRTFSITPFSPPPSSLLPANGGPYRADAFPGDPSKWRDPQRDFDAEYEEVVAAVPSLQGTRPARLAFLIMAHGPTDVKLLKRSLPWLYSPLNFFLVGAVRCVLGVGGARCCSRFVLRRCGVSRVRRFCVAYNVLSPPLRPQ